MKKAIVLGCRNVGLGVIRSLTARDIKIMAVPTEVFDFAQFSRFVEEKTERICPAKESRKLLDFLLNLDKAWDEALILPTTDPSVMFIAQNRQELSSRYIPAAQEPARIGKILYKAPLYLEAREIGIPLPKVLFPDTVEELTQQKHDLTYPCILKPDDAHHFFSIFKKKVLIAENFVDLIEKFKLVQENNLRVVVSEIIPGADDHIYNYPSYIGYNGEVLAELCMQKIRQHPPGFGMARVAKTVPMIQKIRDLSLQLLKRFSYRGFSSVEFKFDQRDNQYKLMEINSRYELQERLFFAAGINFPYITYLDYVEGKHVSSVYEAEIYWIDLINDIYHFITSRKIEKYSWKEYFRPYYEKKVFCTPFFDDPAPFIARCHILLREHGKRFMIRLPQRK